MQLSADVVIPFHRSLVYETYRDRIVDLVPFLPNVRSIEVKERRDEPPLVHFVNVWHGGGDIPAVARAFVSENMLSWTDYAAWNALEFSVEWRTETHSFRDAVKAAGKNHFIEVGEHTRLEIRGDITIDPAGVRGVPGFIAKRAAPAIAEFLVARIRPNLLEVAEGVRKYLVAQQS